MENLVHPLLALESLGFKVFRSSLVSTRNKKFYCVLTYSVKHGVIARVGYPSVGKSLEHVVEYYKLV